MYALVYSPNGIVGGGDSWVRLYDTKEEAHAAMAMSLNEYIITYHPEEYRDGIGWGADWTIDESHAAAEIAYGDGPEWHIYGAYHPATRDLYENVSFEETGRSKAHS